MLLRDRCSLILGFANVMLLIWLEERSSVITIISSFLELDSDVAENHKGGGIIEKVDVL